MRISHNTGSILKQMLRRSADVNRELATAARRAGLVLNKASKETLQLKIYNVPIPLKASADQGLRPGAKTRQKTTKGKAGLWQRTGNLKRQETFRTDGTTIILTNNANYAKARFQLGLPGHRQPKSPGVKSVQWQLEAIKQEQGYILKLRREAVLKALRG